MNAIQRVSLVAVLAAAVLPAAAEQVTLQLDTSPQVLRIMTPLRGLKGGVEFSARGDSGTITVCDKSIKVGAIAKYPSFGLGVDEDGDGEIGRNEFTTFRLRTQAASYKIDLGEDRKNCPLGVDNINISYKKNNVTSFSGDLCPGWAMKGRLGNDEIRLIDSNLDGRYTQDGDDAIAIGRADCAMPLLKVHEIDGKHYELSVAEDGTTVDLTEVADLELGKVATKFPRAMLKGLVVRNMSGQCYDVTTSGRTGIPAGSYSIVYGVLARGRDYAFLLPPETTYDIQAGGTNTLKLGPEFTLTFSASFSGGKVNIGTGTGVMGAGGERYRFSEAPDKPYAYFFVGKRKVAGGAFSKG
jgi:hypothetical protein